MSTPGESKVPETLYPIRFGIFDIIAALVLFGMHLSGAKYLLRDGGPRNLEDSTRLAAAAVLCGAFAFGAAYLAFRRITSEGTRSYALRLLTLLAVDLLLIAIPFGIYAAVVLVISFPILALLLLFGSAAYVIRSANPMRKEK